MSISQDVEDTGMVNTLAQLLAGRTPDIEPTPSVDLFIAEVGGKKLSLCIVFLFQCEISDICTMRISGSSSSTSTRKGRSCLPGLT